LGADLARGGQLAANTQEASGQEQGRSASPRGRELQKPQETLSQANISKAVGESERAALSSTLLFPHLLSHFFSCSPDTQTPLRRLNPFGSGELSDQLRSSNCIFWPASPSANITI